MGRGQYGLLELRREFPGAEAAHSSELLVRTPRRQRRRLQHSVAGSDKRKWPYRIARPACRAAQPVSHSIARAARRRGGSPDRHGEPDGLTEEIEIPIHYTGND